MKIGQREIAPGQPSYIIAEVSCNRGCSLSRAVELIKHAHWAGADAVKFQA
jgi:pseudaminic acid synthase